MRVRADNLLVEKGLCESRALARRLILAGEVRVGPDRLVQKASDLLSPDADLCVRTPRPYVSRGADKLLAILAVARPDLRDAVALDVGASTGGFTEVLLREGVRRVYAVDAGFGQLHARLRADPRVACRERVNARYLSAEHVPEPIDAMTADVSFISLRKILPACAPFLKPGAWVFVLVKPQFEARREEVGRGGVVRDPSVQARCVEEVCAFAEHELGWSRVGTVPSPIAGPKGNRETMAAFRTA
ncbi:MAG: 16S/23S rRNA (cytidine-2'-O)-methyltransferase TlyA [Lentisphaerae bacterium ADurb.BinA184]|nr:MAG: 16S/23S rRNA (cytidine-2'-O)-methyltransferase TlyA [Lentisphaerae bacterium ADurb.BinA184]